MGGRALGPRPVMCFLNVSVLVPGSPARLSPWKGSVPTEGGRVGVCDRVCAEGTCVQGSVSAGP